MNTDANIGPVLVLKPVKPTLVEVGSLSLIQGGIEQAEFSISEPDIVLPDIGSVPAALVPTKQPANGISFRAIAETTSQTIEKSLAPVLPITLSETVHDNPVAEIDPPLTNTQITPHALSFKASVILVRPADDGEFFPPTGGAQRAQADLVDKAINTLPLENLPVGKPVEHPDITAVPPDGKLVNPSSGSNANAMASTHKAESGGSQLQSYAAPIPKENGTRPETVNDARSTAQIQLTKPDIEMIGSTTKFPDHAHATPSKGAPVVQANAVVAQNSGVVEFNKETVTVRSPDPTGGRAVENIAKNFSTGLIPSQTVPAADSAARTPPVHAQPIHPLPPNRSDLQRHVVDPAAHPMEPFHAVERPILGPNRVTPPASLKLSGPEISFGTTPALDPKAGSIPTKANSKTQAHLPPHLPPVTKLPTAPDQVVATPSTPSVQIDPVLEADPLFTPDISVADVKTLGAIGPSERPVIAQLPPEIAQRSLQIIAQAAAQLSDRPVELTLNPEELGKVRLTLQSTEGAMMVSIAVERQETLDLLRRHIGQLAEQLREIGYQDLKFDFSGQSSFSGRDGDNPDQPGPQTPTVENSTETQGEPDPLRLNISNQTAVDIRL